MDLTEEIKNYHTLGAAQTLAQLDLQEREIQGKRHVIQVLSVISEIKSLIETKKFEDYGIKSLQLGLWENIEGTYYFESNLLNSKGSEVQYVNERGELIEPCLKIIHALEMIKNAVNFISVEKENKIFDLTTLGLQQLQNFLLMPELQASVEKAMLQEAVNHSTTHKTASVLKL